VRYAVYESAQCQRANFPLRLLSHSTASPKRQTSDTSFALPQESPTQYLATTYIALTRRTLRTRVTRSIVSHASHARFCRTIDCSTAWAQHPSSRTSPRCTCQRSSSTVPILYTVPLRLHHLEHSLHHAQVLSPVYYTHCLSWLAGPVACPRTTVDGLRLRQRNYAR
jgi:hypothetical protein